MRRSVKATVLYRQAMNRRGDRRKPIYITEITWPASKGKTDPIPRQLQDTPRGMAAKLGQMYAKMIGRRRALGLGKVFWYTWSSPYGGESNFHYTGLLRYDDNVFTAQPALARVPAQRPPFRGLQQERDRRLPVALALGEQRVERLVDRLGRSAPGELRGPPSAGVDQPMALGAHGLDEGGREGLLVVRVRQQRGAGAGLGQGGAVGRDDGVPAAMASTHGRPKPS